MAGEGESKLPQGLGASGDPGDPWLASESEDEFEQLAELFLGEGDLHVVDGPHPGTDCDGPDPNSDPHSVLIEALVLGHLPVKAAPWVVQYAHATALHTGSPVGLMRVTDGQVLVDLLGMEKPLQAEVPAQSLIQAISMGSAHAGRWIIQVDEQDEAIVAGDRRVGAVTLLAGANDAAVVAAYRSLKAIFLSRSAHAATQAAVPIRVAIMGAPREDADAAIAKIQRASQTQLHEDVGVGPCVTRMGPTGSIALYRADSQGLALDRILARLASPVHIGPESVPDAAPHDPVEVARPPGPARTEPATVLPTPDELELLQQPLTPIPEAPPEPAPSTPRPASANARSQAPPVLTSLVAGLAPFEARCPDEEGVDLAIDAAGTLHLLRYDSDGKGIEPLVAVEAWARKHARLLAMAAPSDHPLDPTSACRMHLFTDCPKRVRHLLDGRAQIRVLAPVAVDASVGWYCSELN